MDFSFTLFYDGQRKAHISGSCREYGMSRICDYANSRSTIQKIQFHHRPNPYVQEIAEAFGMKFETTTDGSAFSTQSEFTISDNEEHILPAWYWITLALRIKGDTWGSFQEALEATMKEVDVFKRDNDYLYNDVKYPLLYTLFYCATSVAERSLHYWNLLLQEKVTPTSQEMLSERCCILSYFLHKGV